MQTISMFNRKRVTVPDVLTPGCSTHFRLHDFKRETPEGRFHMDRPEFKIEVANWKLEHQATVEFIMGFLKFHKRHEYSYLVIEVRLSHLGQQALKSLDHGGLWDRSQQGECQHLTREHWERVLTRASLSEHTDITYLRKLMQVPEYGDFKGKLMMWMMTATPHRSGGKDIWMQEIETNPETGALEHARSQGFRPR